jgi:hypothetical protein
MEWQGLIIHHHEIELKLKRSGCAPKVSVRRLGWLILPVLRPPPHYREQYLYGKDYKSNK